MPDECNNTDNLYDVIPEQSMFKILLYISINKININNYMFL